MASNAGNDDTIVEVNDGLNNIISVGSGANVANVRTNGRGGNGDVQHNDGELLTFQRCLDILRSMANLLSIPVIERDPENNQGLAVRRENVVQSRRARENLVRSLEALNIRLTVPPTPPHTPQAQLYYPEGTWFYKILRCLILPAVIYSFVYALMEFGFYPDSYKNPSSVYNFCGG